MCGATPGPRGHVSSRWPQVRQARPRWGVVRLQAVQRVIDARVFVSMPVTLNVATDRAAGRVVGLVLADPLEGERVDGAAVGAGSPVLDLHPPDIELVLPLLADLTGEPLGVDEDLDVGAVGRRVDGDVAAYVGHAGMLAQTTSRVKVNERPEIAEPCTPVGRLAPVGASPTRVIGWATVSWALNT